MENGNSTHRWPDRILSLVRTSEPPRTAVPLIVLDEQSFPHVALLTYLEFAWFQDHVYLGLRSETRTSSFLASNPKCTLLFVAEQGVWVIKASAIQILEQERRVFRLDLVSVKEDKPPTGERRAELTGGMTFRMENEIWRLKKLERQALSDLLKASENQ